MGLGEEEFWQLTMPQLNALIERYNLAEERNDYRVAVLVSVLVNIFRKKGKRAITPEDILGKKKEKKEQTWQEQLNIVKRLNTMFGGKIRDETVL